jgi:hypothetical protein
MVGTWAGTSRTLYPEWARFLEFESLGTNWWYPRLLDFVSTFGTTVGVHIGPCGWSYSDQPGATGPERARL